MRTFLLAVQRKIAGIMHWIRRFAAQEAGTPTSIDPRLNSPSAPSTTATSSAKSPLDSNVQVGGATASLPTPPISRSEPAEGSTPQLVPFQPMEEPRQADESNHSAVAPPEESADTEIPVDSAAEARQADAIVDIGPLPDHVAVESADSARRPTDGTPDANLPLTVICSPVEPSEPIVRALPKDSGNHSDADIPRETQPPNNRRVNGQDGEAVVERQPGGSSRVADASGKSHSRTTRTVAAAVTDTLADLPEVELDAPSEQGENSQNRRPSVSTDGEDAAIRNSISAKDRPKQPRPSPESFVEPFDDRGLQPPSNDYLRWSKALVEYCLLANSADNEEVFLTITPRILSAALGQVTGIILSLEDSEIGFAEAVSAIYRSRVLTHPRKLATLRRCGPDGLPECTAFLALSVLAAYRMQTDEDATASAYYIRLEELLRCGLSGGLPHAFEYDEFEGLWLFLRAWLEREHRRRLAMPKSDVGLRRYVALPLTHVPLRRVDIERLPDFFEWAGYEPGARIVRSRLDEDLGHWSRSRAAFTNAGMAALADERRVAVLAQIAHELESWDGSHTDSLGRRSGRVEILLDIVQRKPQLSYLPRRPDAFPRVFDDGAHAFEASEEGWYDPLPIQAEDGPNLRAGFSWEIVSGQVRLALRRPGVAVIGLPASNEYTGFLSHRGLRLGAMAATLCCDDLAGEASQYLSEISQQRCSPLRHPSLPDGWQLFTGIRVQRRLSPPAGLEALTVEDTINLIPGGGLRLGSRWAWLAGAPPQLTVTGIEAGQLVTIDGKPVAISDDGSLAAERHLAQPGIHLVETSGLRRRVEIVEPALSARLQAPTALNIAVALPPGSWSLLGAVPGEVAAPAFRSLGGSLATCPFPAVWAVESGRRRGVTVLSLSLAQPRYAHSARIPAHGPALRSILAWASTIYDAVIRHPRFDSLRREGNGAELANVWNQYAQAARDIKRRIRKAQR